MTAFATFYFTKRINYSQVFSQHWKGVVFRILLETNERKRCVWMSGSFKKTAKKE